MENNSKHLIFFSKIFSTVPLIFLLLFFSGCSLRKAVMFSGQTMGTTYHITVITGYFKKLSGLKEKIDGRLEEINQSMSTYRKDSEISRFNAWHQIGQKFQVSEDFFQVMTVAQNIYGLTGGAWDGTLKPLIDLWGFGSSTQQQRVPSKAEIQVLLPNIGFHHIEIGAGRYLVKKNAAVTLDFASIAKGYAVDQIAALIQTEGIDNFLVEIGGEVFASGLRKDGQQWRVGINMPQQDAPFDQVYKAVSLSGKAFATSGDYRIYFEKGGRRYSHILDPKNGYPIANQVVSVSILADTCTFADGLATAVMVLGADKGLALVNRLAGIECLIVVQDHDGALNDYVSTGFKAYVRTS